MYKVTTHLADRLDQITHLTSDCNYTWVHLADGKREIYGYCLLWFEQQFPQLGLVRLHKTISVPAARITSWQRSVGKREMRVRLNGQQIEVAKRRVYIVARQLSKTTPQNTMAPCN
jgi:DNA-binding LytR/AlgR family response regulator